MSAAITSDADGSGTEPAGTAGGGETCIPGGSTLSRIILPLAKPLELAKVDPRSMACQSTTWSQRQCPWAS